MFNKKEQEHIAFTQSARRHKIGRARVREVLSEPVAVIEVSTPPDLPTRFLVIGEDFSGRPLEVIVLREDERLVVIHAMDLRPKYRAFYEEGLDR